MSAKPDQCCASYYSRRRRRSRRCREPAGPSGFCEKHAWIPAKAKAMSDEANEAERQSREQHPANEEQE